jgi:hypothetical protein
LCCPVKAQVACLIQQHYLGSSTDSPNMPHYYCTEPVQMAAAAVALLATATAAHSSHAEAGSKCSPRVGSCAFTSRLSEGIAGMGPKGDRCHCSTLPHRLSLGVARTDWCPVQQT